MSVRDCWNYPKIALLRSCLAVWTFFSKKKTDPQNIAVWTVWGIEKTKAPKSDASNFPRTQKQIKASRFVWKAVDPLHHFTQTRNLTAGPSWAYEREERRKPTVPILPVVPAFGLASGAHPGRPNQFWPTSGNASTHEHPKSQMYRSPQIIYIYIINYI